MKRKSQPLRKRINPFERTTAVRCGIGAVDGQMRGGLRGGELATILSFEKERLSAAFNSFMRTAYLHGRNVAYYTLDEHCSDVLTRMDAGLAGLGIQTVSVRSPEANSVTQVREARPAGDRDGLGEFVIKSFRGEETTVAAIADHLSCLEHFEDFHADLVIVDYADPLLHSGEFDRPRDKRSAIYQQLSSLANRLNVPVWTAGHVNHDGDPVPPLFAHLAESVDTARVGDHIFVLLPAGAGESLGATDFCTFQIRHTMCRELPSVVVDFSHDSLSAGRQVA